MPANDDAEDDAASGPPLPPDDRLWRHPSEMQSEANKQQIVLISKPAASLGRTAAVAAIAGLLGAAATIGLVLGTDLFVREKQGITSKEVVELPLPKNPDETQLAIAERVLPSIARVEASGPKGVVTATAVVFRSDGLLITTADAVDAASSLTVYLNDGTKLDGENVALVGKSSDADIAVIKINRTDLPVAIGSKTKPAWGARMVMIDASPQTRGPEVTVGVITKEVAAVARGEDKPPVYGLVQVTTRASVTPRGAGTVFIDNAGTVIGLVTSRAEAPLPIPEHSPDTVPGTTLNPALDTSNALHFAVPGDFAWDIAGQITDKGQVVKPWIGVPYGEDVPENQLSRDGVGGGLRITFIEDGSPAKVMGKLRVNDVIIALEDDNVRSYNDLVAALRRHKPGDTIKITYLRDGETNPAILEVGGKPELS